MAVLSMNGQTVESTMKNKKKARGDIRGRKRDMSCKITKFTRDGETIY